MNDTRAGKKEKCQYIQVFVRVRPTSSAEKNSKSTTIVEIPNESEVIVHERPHEKFSKKYKFDNVFGPSSKQIDVYNVVVSPLLEQVLAGFNCTVFAYGQTGTGKTFTMEGINNDPTLHWQSDSSAGIIPRSLSHLFDKLQLMEAQEYTIRASFLELYNEDLFDLLSPNDDGSKIRLYEDSSKKGAVIIHGLEEVTVHNKCDVYTILQKGSERRQTAATLMNSQSSRSHTVFSITVHMKENAIEGEEVLKTGKLNLVDLAGSENVGKSGAVDRRAREAGSINQSLLTLGRVITALVERAPHIPYRESKLTRLLQESLGGRTKTSIIATISPAGINLEETLSTLDYALRAKSITNRPEINQKVSKKEFLRQYTEEIERLRKDLLATRERNGVYLANENYNEMQAQISQQNKELEEKINHIKALEKMLQDKEKIFNDLELQNHAQMKELHEAKIKLTSATDALISTKSRLKQTAQEKEEQKYLVEKHMHTEQTLLSEAQTLLTVADTATADSHKLHDKIARKNETEQTFGTLCEEFKTKYREGLQGIKQDVTTYAEKLVQFGLCMKRNLDAQSAIECSSIDTPTHEDTSVSQCVSETEDVTQTINRLYTSYEKWTENETNNTVSTVNAGNELLDSSYRKMVQNINGIIDREILKHLQIMKSKVSQKLNEANSIIKDMLDSACTSEMEIYNKMRKDVEQITKDIEVLSKKQKFTEKQRLLTKKMEALYSQFNILNQCQEHYYSDVIKKCNHITKVCNEVNEQTSNNYNINVTTNNNLKGLIESNVREIEKHVTEETQLCEDLAEKSVKQGKVIINELTSKISENCNKMERYKNLIKCNAKDMQSQINADRMETLSLVNEANKAILDISKNYTQFMQDKKLKCVKDSDEMSKKLNDEVEKLYTWSKEVTKKLQKVENEIEKFFNTDIERDVPTGATPVRREFSYPRQFKPTSPHERILQRFRESRKFVETLEDDDDVCLSSDITMKQIANSTAIADVIDMPDSLDNTVLAVSAVNNDLQKNTVLRQSIESELERITQTFNDSSICMHPRSQSEPTIYITNGNKENHNCGISTHDKVKITQKSRLKKPKAKILGIHN